MAGTMMHYLAGQWTRTDKTLEVANPWNGEPVGSVYLADAAAFTQAIDAAERARDACASMPIYERTRVLNAVAAALENDVEKFAQMITWESGRAIRDTRGEVGRAVFTFRVAAEEARRIHTECEDLDWLPGTDNRYAIIRRVPIGVVGAITPFNFPLNLVAHKVAPAIAAGCPIVVKPSSQTPIIALMLTKLLDDAGLPPGALSVLPAPASETSPLVEDERVKLLTFTGSPDVGWALKQRAGRKRVALELGGNAGCIVHSDADVDFAVNRVVYGGFAHAGQSCISVQRVFLHESIADRFIELLLARVKTLKVGDPSDSTVDLGGVVNNDAADRIAAWLDEAKGAGVTVLTGGGHDGRTFEPTVLTDVPPGLRICAQEAFAPVVVLDRYSDFDVALEHLGTTRYGLQAGLFTYDLRLIDQAFRSLEVGGLIVNDIPTFRTDQMPYGGVRDSGVGKEGPRFAIEEMTEPRLLVVNLDRPA